MNIVCAHSCDISKCVTTEFCHCFVGFFFHNVTLLLVVTGLFERISRDNSLGVTTWCNISARNEQTIGRDEFVDTGCAVGTGSVHRSQASLGRGHETEYTSYSVTRYFTAGLVLTERNTSSRDKHIAVVITSIQATPLGRFCCSSHFKLIFSQ